MKYKSRYMITCPAQDKCAMRSQWKGTEQDAIESWNNEVQAARYENGRGNHGK